MKVAVCMSGLARTFKKCYQSYADNIFSHYDCDVFLNISKDANSPDMDAMTCVKKNIIEKDPVLDEKGLNVYKKRCRKYSTQGILQQLWKIRDCHNMMLDYQKEKGIRYDWVIRCRPDLQILRQIDDLSTLDNRYMYFPAYLDLVDRWKGMYDKDFVYDYSYCCLADQFAVGSVEMMGVYARRYDDLEGNCAKAGELHPEGSLTFHLKHNHVPVKFLRPLIRIVR